MDAQPESAASRVGERFAYFMVRVQTNADTQTRTSGVVERLGTGRKQSFSTIEELVRLLTDGPGDVENMEVGTPSGNESIAGAADRQLAQSEPPNNPVGGK